MALNSSVVARGFMCAADLAPNQCQMTGSPRSQLPAQATLYGIKGFAAETAQVN